MTPDPIQLLDVRDKILVIRAPNNGMLGEVAQTIQIYVQRLKEFGCNLHIMIEPEDKIEDLDPQIMNSLGWVKKKGNEK